MLEEVLLALDDEALLALVEDNVKDSVFDLAVPDAFSSSAD